MSFHCYRMKYLVKKWKRATRVGSEVVGGTADQINGKNEALLIMATLHLW